MAEEKNAPEIEDDFRKVLLADFQLACVSREVSLLGRKAKPNLGFSGMARRCVRLHLQKL